MWLITTNWLSFLAKKLEFFLKMLQFFLKMLQFFTQSPWVFSKTQEFWRFGVRYLKKQLCLAGNLFKNIAPFAHICPLFWLIYSKNAENRMSFYIHLATMATVLLTFGLKNPWVFSKMLKKAWLNQYSKQFMPKETTRFFLQFQVGVQ